MGFFKKLFGICSTPPPSDAGCWSVEDGRLLVDLARAPELAGEGGAIRIEGPTLPIRVLLVHGAGGSFHVFENRCAHMGRRIDPLPGRDEVRCCSLGGSTYDYEGKAISGLASGPIRVLGVEKDGERLVVSLP